MDKIDRLKDVKSLPKPYDEDLCRSDEEAIELFRKALAITKGKCNNRNGWIIAKNVNATLDDIIKFGVKDTYWSTGLAFSHTPHWIKSPADRIREIEQKKQTYVKDSVFGRFIKSRGLWTDEVEEKYRELTTQTLAIYKNCMWCRNSELAKSFLRFLEYARYSDKENRFIKTCGNTAQYWFEHITLTLNDSDVSKARKAMFEKELEWLDHAPQEVLDSIMVKDRHHTQSLTQAIFNSGLCNNNDDTEKGDYVMELTKSFCEVMDHIGLGIADRGERTKAITFASSRIALTSIMKKVMSMGKVFVRLMKQGYEPSLAREEVIDQLNQYVALSKAVVPWEFFALDNAPTNYDYQAKPKSKTSATNGRSKLAKNADADGLMEVPGIGKLKVC